MEHQLWKAIIAILTELDKSRRTTKMDFSDHEIVGVWYWAVVHDRPMAWACLAINWPLHRRRHRLPSCSTMSRRLRTPAVRELLSRLEERVIAPKHPNLYWTIDGKPLMISGCSKDHHAGYGRAAGGKAKGYKIHAIIGGADGSIAAWRLAPMNKDERVMGERLVRKAPIQGYLTADSNYDSNPLHEACVARGNLQLVTHRRYGPGKGHGHRKQSPGRLRSIAIVESPDARFGKGLLRRRSDIERRFGNLTNWWAGLANLPSWVRTYPRVHRWVQAKLVLTALKRSMAHKTYVA